MTEYEGKVTLFDRFAVGFFCASITFITAIFAWLAIYWIFLQAGETGFLYLLKPIIIISFIAGALGFYNKEGKVIDLLVLVWRAVINVFDRP